MYLSDYPLPIVHHYRMLPEQGQRLVRVLAHIDRKRLRVVPGLSASRLASLPDAAAMLSILVRKLGSNGMIVSAYGLREGLLYDRLDAGVRAADPLVCAVREEGTRQGRFAEHGDVLDRWIAPLFAGETVEERRLRHAACLLADVGWRAHPEFRAERGLDIGLHGNWVGIDARGRAMLARALYTSFGGAEPVDIVRRLCSLADEALADRWGHAIRLAQRLSGGVAAPLVASRLSIDAGTLSLHLSADERALYGETVERRHRALALVFQRKPALAID